MKIDKSRKLILGVCSGLAADLSWDPWAVRILFLLLAHFVGFGILVYFGLYLLMDKNS